MPVHSDDVLLPGNPSASLRKKKNKLTLLVTYRRLTFLGGTNMLDSHQGF